MVEKYKTCQHTPAHLFKSNSIYMITGATYKKRGLLTGEEPKLRWYESLKRGCEEYGWQIWAWVVLDNHYHIILEAPEEAETLPSLIRDLHRFTALWVKKNVATAKEIKRIWYNYWDTCISYQTSFLARLNYVHHNPVKHGYVEDASEYPFGSYYTAFREQRDMWLKNEKKYPWDKVKVSDDF